MATNFDTTLQNLGIGRTTTGPTVKTAGQADQLSQNDFLKLLTAQLKNQDPTDPVDATQQLTQLAQFSTVSGISEINSTLKSIQDKLGSTSTSDALAYVGHNVLTEGNTAYPRQSGGIAGAVDLAGNASDVRVAIVGPDGSVLKTLSLGAQTKGTVEFDWDGITDSGEAAGNGPYTLNVTANNNGAVVGATPLVWAPVTAVSLPATGGPQLTLPGIGTVAASKVRQIG